MNGWATWFTDLGNEGWVPDFRLYLIGSVGLQQTLTKTTMYFRVKH